MGKLLDYLKAPHPVDAEPLRTQSFGLIPYKLPPVIMDLPNHGPEPINAAAPATSKPLQYAQAPAASKANFMERWSAITGGRPDWPAAEVRPQGLQGGTLNSADTGMLGFNLLSAPLPVK
jgi:hypothetical protein